MPAPGAPTYSSQCLIDAQQSFLDNVDAGAGPGKVQIRDASDVLLSEIILTDPAGTIDGAGQLTITPAGPDTAANAAGVAAYGEVKDSDDILCLSMDTSAGTVAVEGELVINSLNIILGAPVTLLSFTVG